MIRSQAAALGFLLLTGCAQVPPAGSPSTTADRPLDGSSLYFDVSQTQVPPAHAAVVEAALRRIDAALTTERFYTPIQAKTDWTYVAPPATVAGIAASIRQRIEVGSGEPVRPRLIFYKPAYWGKDICGGAHWGPFYQTKSTGCTSNDGKTIYRNVVKMTDDEVDTAEFLVHEWLHAAGYKHGDNYNQCRQDKRNSVPIHVACLAAAFPNSAEMTECSLPC